MRKTSVLKTILNVAHTGLTSPLKRNTCSSQPKTAKLSQKFIMINNTNFPDTVMKTVIILETVLFGVTHVHKTVK
jgi:hypothetical protein